MRRGGTRCVPGEAAEPQGISSRELSRFTPTYCWAPVPGTPGQPHRVHAHSHKASVNTSLRGQIKALPVPLVSKMSLGLRGKDGVPGGQGRGRTRAARSSSGPGAAGTGGNLEGAHHSGTPQADHIFKGVPGEQRPGTETLCNLWERKEALRGSHGKPPARLTWGPTTPHSRPALPASRRPVRGFLGLPLNLGAWGRRGPGHYAGAWPAAPGRRANLTFIWERPAAGARGAAIDRG